MQDLLKFITCGSVDDGKSTLIGHMLYDAKLLFADQEQALLLDSRAGSREGGLDYSLLLDGLMAEREQGITIDVAYRYFTTKRRSFIVADTPGHEEYTRNMAVGASFANLAVILVDVSQGLLSQTRRHTRICSLMGIRHFVFALNKMDLVGYDGSAFLRLEREIRALMAEFDVASIQVIPVSATEGDNVTFRSARMPWYQGPALLEYLEQVDAGDARTERGAGASCVLPVQRISRPNHSFRGIQGNIASGALAAGDRIRILPSGEEAGVRALMSVGRESQSVGEGEAVTVQLDREVDVSRGCVIVKGFRPSVTNLLNATLLWMDDAPLVTGKSYYIKCGTKLTAASVLEVKYQIDVNTGEHILPVVIGKNALVNCDIFIAEKIVAAAFRDEPVLGRFILIDRITNMTACCGVVEHSLRRNENLYWQKLDITRKFRAGRMGQRPVTLWFTGLSGSGKSTLANALEKRLVQEGRFTMLLDGDNVRMGLNRDLGFKEEDRIENIRRIAEVSKLLNDAGLIVLTAFISPYRADRDRAREILGDSMVEIYLSTPLEECEKRDVKGLYKKARKGDLPNFTGISSAYEPPQNPDVQIDTAEIGISEAVEEILRQVSAKFTLQSGDESNV